MIICRKGCRHLTIEVHQYSIYELNKTVTLCQEDLILIFLRPVSPKSGGTRLVLSYCLTSTQVIHDNTKLVNNSQRMVVALSTSFNCSETKKQLYCYAIRLKFNIVCWMDRLLSNEFLPLVLQSRRVEPTACLSSTCESVFVSLVCLLSYLFSFKDEINTCVTVKLIIQANEFTVTNCFCMT